MGVLLELLFYVLLEYIFTIPGAMIRWAYFRLSGKKVSFKECMTRKVGWNYGVSIVTTLLVVLAVRIIL